MMGISENGILRFHHLFGIIHATFCRGLPFVRNNINQISPILEPSFKFKMLDAGNSLCSLLKMVSAAFPPEAVNAPQDVKMLYKKVEELVQKHLAMVLFLFSWSQQSSCCM